jgi:D-amino peptidase
MDHTIFGKMVVDVWINDVLVGETGINAGIAGSFGVPVGLVTGDDKVTKEASALLGDIETAVVKEGIDRYAAKCFPLEQTRERIKTAAKAAVLRRSELKPFRYSSPVKFKVRLASSAEAAVACRLPAVTKEDARTVSIVADDCAEAFPKFRGILALASTVVDEEFG